MNINVAITYIIYNMFKLLHTVYFSLTDIWKIPRKVTTCINNFNSSRNCPFYYFFGNSLFVFRLWFTVESELYLCYRKFLQKSLLLPFRLVTGSGQLVLSKVQAHPIMFLFQTWFLSLGILKKITILFKTYHPRGKVLQMADFNCLDTALKTLWNLWRLAHKSVEIY